ncbi:MAG TPA: hypothetical protein DCM27_08215 [Rhodospirillaceae bacterium]|nr:hypothetical protein [Rhodospirillaceae bacterium]
MPSILKKYFLFNKTFGLNGEKSTFWLVSGGVLMSFMEFLGISAIFPLLLLVMNPSASVDHGLLRGLYQFFGVNDPAHLAMILGVCIAGLFFVKNIFQIFYWKYEFSTLAKWRVQIIRKLYNAYMASSFESYMKRSSSGMMNTLIFTSPNAINFFVHPLLNLLNYALTAFVILSYIIYTNWAAALVIFLVAIGFIKIYFMTIKAYTIKLGKQVNDMAAEQQSLLQQSFIGYKDTKVNLKEHFFSDRFFKIAKNFSDSEERLLFLRGLPPAIVELMAITLLIAIFQAILLTGQDIKTATAQIGVIVLACVRLLPIMNRSISAITYINGAKTIVDDLLKEAEELNIREDSSLLKANRDHDYHALPFLHRMTLDNVSYTYPGKEMTAVRNMSLTLQPGEFIGMTGPSGGGKSTLTNILLGFLDRFDGQYKIDDTEISHENIRNLRKIIGYVDQNIFMMDATIAENIAFGVEKANIDEGKVIESLQKAQIWDHVQSLPDGIYTYIGENGKLFSGGQRQRLAIARAFYRDIRILILDEASAALDVETEFKFFNFLESLKGQLTVIMIAHRLSTLKSCDRIYFIEDGEVKDCGTFEELYRINPKFKTYINFSQIDISKEPEA